MKKLTAVLLTVSAIACGGNKSGSGAVAGRTAEADRYYKAIDATFEGDSRAGYDGLLELAADSPDTRAGRKARAVLMADDPLLYIAGIGILSAVAIPSWFGKSAATAAVPPVPTGRMIAGAIYDRQLAYHDQFRRYETPVLYARDLSSTYLIMAGPKNISGGDELGQEVRSAIVKRANAKLAALHLKPGVTKTGYLIAVAGDPDDSGRLDLWTVDQDRNIMHLAGDADFE